MAPNKNEDEIYAAICAKLC